MIHEYCWYCGNKLSMLFELHGTIMYRCNHGNISVFYLFVNSLFYAVDVGSKILGIRTQYDGISYYGEFNYIKDNFLFKLTPEQALSKIEWIQVFS